MIVTPSHRLRGIGSALIAWRTRWAWTQQEPAWYFTNASNTASLTAHQRLGFTEVLRAPRILDQTFHRGEGVLCRADPPTTVEH